MYSPAWNPDAAAIESEVFYWRLLGIQAIFIYFCVAIALCTGVIDTRDKSFDACIITVTTIFVSNLIYMPQSKQRNFRSCRIKRKKLSNAAYRFSGHWKCRRLNRIAGQKVESGAYEEVHGSRVWGGLSFRSEPKFSQRRGILRRGSRFHFRSCGSISSRPALICGSPGDVALRGSYILAGEAAVRWYIVLFHRVPALAIFVARFVLYCFFCAMRIAVYCFIGATCDAALAFCRVVLLAHIEITVILRTCIGSPGDVALRGICILLGHAALVRWYVVAFHYVTAVAQFTAQMAVYCLKGAIFDIAIGICRVAVLAHMEIGAVASMTRHFGGPMPHHLAGRILRRCRGSGFRNFYLGIFVLFLLSGFLLEGNPPRGLAAPPMHAGGADQPARRWSERLAQNNSSGSTFLRQTQPDVHRTYVQHWPMDRERSAPEVSMVDPDSPAPKSPEVEAVEAAVLDGCFDLLNTMRSLDGPDSIEVQHTSMIRDQIQDIQVTQDIGNPDADVDCSAPVSDVDHRDHRQLPSADDVIEIEEDSADVDVPKPASQELQKSARPKAKAKAGAYKWVPKAQQGGGVRGVSEAWATLDDITLTEEWKHSCATVQEVPQFVARQVQEAFYIATSRIRVMHTQDKQLELERAWKLFLLLPRMLLSRTKMKGEEGKAEFFSRVRAFHRGEWVKLVQQARLPKRKKAQRGGTDVEAKLRAAENRARLGELSHARQELVGTPLAPRTMETYYKLADPSTRPQQPRSLERLRQVCQFQPNSFVDLDYRSFVSNVRSSPRGKSGGLSGMRNEHLKCLVFSPRLEDTKALFYVAESLARAQIPDAIRKALALARMTALDKGKAKVRGIAAGDTFRRVVAKTLAQQFGHEFDEACSPFQFALSTRAGTDCVGHALREISNQYPDKVTISLDGIGAYDHIDRAQMLESLVALPNACSLLPFVAMFYGHTSEYYWTNEDGEVWSIEQGDGGEQGDPLMPALFALGQHPALVSAQAKLEVLNCEEGGIGENYFRPLLFAFLDDLYVVANPEIARKAFDIVTGEVEAIAGIRTNLGKLQLYSKAGGPCPPGFEELQAQRAIDAPIWTCDASEISKRGIVVLGSPLGSEQFIKAHAEKRMQVEQELLDWIPRLPTLQVAWLLLYYCAAQRANHLIRLLPPSLSAEYAEKHDQAILHCLETLLQAGPLSENAKRVANLRCVNGGLGLRSARRTAQAAFWAAWADALPMLRSRVPEHACNWSDALEFAQANVAHVEFLRQLPSGLQEAELARRQLVAEGYRDCPSWEDIREGVLPPNPDPKDRAPGEWGRGWQFYASRVRDKRFLDFEVKPQLSPTEQALLLSQGGPFASQFLQALPTKVQLEIENSILQCLMRRRLRLPLADGLCTCPANSHGSGRNWSKVKVVLDAFGDHLASCMRTGRVQRRANVLEKIWMQVFREAGGTVVPNEKLRNMRIGVDPEDNRRIEFCVYNLFSVPLLCDVTQVSPIAQNGIPHPKCAVEAGAALKVAVERKNSTYREAQESEGQVKLQTLACEVGGRWHSDCVDWVGRLAKMKASAELPHLQRAAEFAWHSRWWSLLSVAAQRAFALSLIEVDCEAIKPLADYEPKVGAVLADVRYELESAVSRLPLRG